MLIRDFACAPALSDARALCGHIRTLLRGHLAAVYGNSLDYLSPNGEATIYLNDVQHMHPDALWPPVAARSTGRR